jgi:rhodanese-related sulfurtransferase
MVPTAPVRAALLATLLLVVVSAFGSCSTSEAEGTVVQASPTRAAALVESGDYIVLDLRSAAAYEAGHVRDAIHVPFTPDGFVDRLDRLDLDPDAGYLVYSRQGQVASRAADVMVAAGFDRVVDAGAFGPLAIAGAPLAD